MDSHGLHASLIFDAVPNTNTLRTRCARVWDRAIDVLKHGLLWLDHLIEDSLSYSRHQDASKSAEKEGVMSDLCVRTETNRKPFYLRNIHLLL